MRTWIERLGGPAARLGHAFWWSRAVTLGVRMAAIDGGRVLLVRHTYRPGWYLPGGAVDRGETVEQAAIREMHEEAGLVCLERPRLFGLYLNRHGNGRDHVACFVADRWRMDHATSPGGYEIAEAGFFPLDALPPGTTRATRARLAEIAGDAPIDPFW